MMVAGQGLTVLGILIAMLFVHIYFISSLEHGRTQRALLRRYSVPLGFGQAPIGGSLKTGTPMAVLDIPKIGTHEVVVEGTSGKTLTAGPGHLRTSPYPGQAGNSVIAGRRVAYGGPFRRLDRLRPGDTITTTTGQGKATYVVRRIEKVRAHHNDVIQPTDDNRLTLISSDPALLVYGRIAVIAQLKGDPFGSPRGRPTELPRNELGLQSDGASVLPLLLWTEALFVAAIAATWLFKRWRRGPAWLVAAPVLLVLLLLVFDSFVPLLPATL
jgi:LPXTG-site transpeptidase (sortase) family protein